MISGTRADAAAAAGADGEGPRATALRLSAENNLMDPHRRGAGLPRLADPASSEEEAVLGSTPPHLPVEEGPRVHQGQGAGVVPTGRSNLPLGSWSALAQPDAAGLDRFLPALRVALHLPLPARLHLAAGHQIGRGVNTAEPLKRICAAATAADAGGPPRVKATLFDPATVRNATCTATGAQRSPRPWPSAASAFIGTDGARGAPVALVAGTAGAEGRSGKTGAA